MNSIDDEKKKAVAERRRLRNLEAYHNNEARRQYHIDYEKRRREDPIYRARRSALQSASNARKKMSQLEANRENIQQAV